MLTRPGIQRNRRNVSKVAVLLWLWKYGRGKFLPVSELARRTGISVHYITTRAPKWHEWKLLSRHPVMFHGRVVWGYGRGQEADEYLDRIRPSVARAAIAHLEEYSRRRAEEAARVR